MNRNRSVYVRPPKTLPAGLADHHNFLYHFLFSFRLQKGRGLETRGLYTVRDAGTLRPLRQNASLRQRRGPGRDQRGVHRLGRPESVGHKDYIVKRPRSLVITEKPAAEVLKGCMENGVLCLTAKDKVRLLPALNIPMDVLKKAVAVIKEEAGKE